MIDAGWIAFISTLVAIVSGVFSALGTYRKMKRNHDIDIAAESAERARTAADIAYIRQSVDDIKNVQKELSDILAKHTVDAAKQEARLDALEKEVGAMKVELSELRSRQ